MATPWPEMTSRNLQLNSLPPELSLPVSTCQLFLDVTKIPSNKEEEVVVWAHSSGGWLANPTALGPQRGRTSRRKGVVEERGSVHGVRRQREKEEKGRGEDAPPGDTPTGPPSPARCHMPTVSSQSVHAG